MFQLQQVPSPTSEHEPCLVGAALCVAFADAEAIAQLREAGAGLLELEPPVSLSDEDCYLVVPSDIGLELVDILRDADHELLHEALRDSLVVSGEVHSDGRGGLRIDADWVRSAAEVLDGGLGFASDLRLEGAADALATINRLDHVQCTMLSALFDDEGLESVLREPEYLGTSWRLPPTARGLAGGVDPTFVWSRQKPDGSVGVELALFVEEEELIALLRPLRLVG
jgi:hypothetical protein